MEGQNSEYPKWLGMSLRVGGYVVLGVLAFTALSAQVDATDLVANENKAAIKEHEERIDLMERILIKNSTILENMEDTLDEIKDDLRDHDSG